MEKHASTLHTRRQLSLFVPEPQRARVERIRQRLDPVQSALIPAHVTLCREDEMADVRDLIPRLARLPPFRISMGFGAPEQIPEGGVLLRPSSGAETFHALRQAVLGASARPYGAHLTLLHPRNAVGAAYDLAAITRELADLVITFEVLFLITQQGRNPWQVTGRYGSR